MQLEESVAATQVWVDSFLSVTLITLLGLLGIGFIPLLRRKPENAEKIFIFLISTAAGALLGDSFLHLLPEAFGLHSDIPASSSPLSKFSVGLTVLGGIYVFFLFERLLSQYHHGHGHGHGSRSHSHSHAHSPIPSESVEQLFNEPPTESTSLLAREEGVHEGHSHSTRDGILPMGYLVLFGDALHNFVDGLAIGVSFATNPRVGTGTTLAVVMHEIPHELGDYAIMLASGFSLYRALLLHMISNISSYIGMAVGILSTQAGEIRPWVLAFTAGNFIYIALADLVPELLHEHQQLRLLPGVTGEEGQALTVNSTEKYWKGLIMNIGVLFGIALMALLGIVFESH